jgi:hypothetical protein
MATSSVLHWELAHSPLSGRGEQISAPVRAVVGADLSEPLSAEMGPRLAQMTEQYSAAWSQ